MQSLPFLQLYEHCKCKFNHASSCVLQADMHRQLHVQAGMPCKFSQYMHANNPEALSHCGHLHDLTSVAQLTVITLVTLDVLSLRHWRQSAFTETPSTACHSREARQRRASTLVIYYVYTVYLEIFARRNFRELPAELNFRVFIFANGTWLFILFI